MDFHGMKRKGLQALCKKHGIPANLTNREMADGLALLLMENEKTITKGQSGLKNLGETGGEIDSVIVTEKVIKKVKFSPENQTFIFVSSDTESVSDHDYNLKKRMRKRKSMSKQESTKQVVRSKNVKKAEISAKVMDSKVRVTRFRAQRVVGTDAEMAFSPPATKKRGRGRTKNVDVCDYPPPSADLVDKDDGYEASAKSRGGLIKRQLRSTDVVTEADEKACDEELAVVRKNLKLKASKKTRNVKASDGVVLVDQIFEDNVLAGEAAKPEKIPKQSKENLTKGKGCSGLNGDLGEIGIGRRSTRSRKVDLKDSAVESESGVHEVQIENQKAPQLEEPVDLGKNISRWKSAAPQNRRGQNEILALERIERGQAKGSRKRSTKKESEGVSESEPIVDLVKDNEDFLPNGPLRRSRRHTASFSSAATSGGELRTHETIGRMKLPRNGPPEADANVGTDAEMAFSPPATKKRGRGRTKNVDVCDNPPPSADLVDKDDGYEASAKSRGGLIKRQLRSTDVVIEADEKACDGELAVLRKNLKLKASKKTRNVKASDGVVLVDQIFEDNVLAGEAAKPEKIPKQSEENLTKGNGCSGLNGDLGEIGIGRRPTRSRKIDLKDSAVESESGIHEVQIENQKAPQLEEPVGLGKNISRWKSAAPQNRRGQNEILALERLERGQLVKGSRKRSTKTESEGVSESEPIVDLLKDSEDFLPNGPLRRSRRHTASFSSAATSGGELRTHETMGRMKQPRNGPPEADANVAQPSKRSSRNATRKFSVENSKEVVGTADGVRKDLQMKQYEEKISAESSISVHEHVTNKPPRRSSRNVSKSNVVEVTNPKGRAAANNKQSKARMQIVVEEGSCRKSSLPLDSDFCCGKENEEMSIKKRKGFKRKSVAISQLGFADVSALNSGKKGSKRKSVATSQLVSTELSALNSGKEGFKKKSTEISQLGSTEVSALNFGKKGATCTTSDLADNVSASMELQGVSIFQEKRDSISEVVFNVKESIIEEAQKEVLFLDNNVEADDLNDQSCHSFNTRGESGDDKLVEQENAEPVECPWKSNNVVSCGFISPVNESAGLKIEESLMEKHINPGTDKEDDLSADSKTDVQGHQNLIELDANGNFDSVQEETVHDDHLSELGASCESERSSEKISNEAEKLHALVPYDIDGIAQIDVDATGTAGSGAERVADTNLEIIAWGDTPTSSSTQATSPSKPAQEIQDGHQLEAQTTIHPEIVGGSNTNHVGRDSSYVNVVPDKVISSGETSFQKVDRQVCCNERREEVRITKEKESEAALNNGLVSAVEKKQKVSDGYLDNVSQEAKAKYTDKIDDDILDSMTTREERGIDVDGYVCTTVTDLKYEKAVDASVIIYSDREVEKHAVEEVELGLLPHLTWEKFQDRKECESPGSSKEIAPVDCKTEASNENQTALLLDKIKFDGLHIDISDPGAADHLMPMNDEDNIEDNDGKDDDDLNSKDDCSEIQREDNLDAVAELNLENMGDHLVNEGVTDMNDTEASLKDHEIEKYAIKEVEQGSRSFMLEKLPVQKECEYRGAPYDVVPVYCKTEASNEIQSALLMDQNKFDDLYIDISDPCAADHLMPLDGEDNNGKEDCELNSKDGCTKTKKEDNLDGATYVNDRNGVFLLNLADEYIRAVPVAPDMECLDEINASKSIDGDTNWVGEISAEVKLSSAICDQPETCSSRVIGSVLRNSSLGDECGSNKPCEGDRNVTIEKGAVVEDRENVTMQRESRSSEDNGDLSDTREDVNVDNNATCQQAAEELVDDINGGVRDTAFMNSYEGMISNEPSNGNGSGYNAKVAEQVLGSPAPVEMPVRFSLSPVSATAHFDGFVVENTAKTSLEAVNEQLDGQRNVLTETGLLDSDDHLDLDHLFYSNSTSGKSNSKETGEELRVQDLENVAVSSGESKDFMDWGNVSIKNHEMNVERSAVSPVTASSRHENKAVEYDAELALSPSCELNLFSEDGKRDKFNDVNLRTSNATLISEAHEVNEGREIDVSIAKVLTEEHCYHEHSCLKHNHLPASDEPSSENEGEPKEQGSIPVITEAVVDCERHKPECVEFENPIEATVFNSNNFASDKPTAECCATDSRLLENHVNPAGEGKHERHIDPSVSSKLIPGDGESSNEQNDVSTIIQENTGCESPMYELIDGMNSYTSMCRLRTAEAAEINGYDCAAVEDAEEDSIAKPGLEKMLEDREEKEAQVMTSETADMEGTENRALVLPLNSMGDDTTCPNHGIEFSKIKDAAPDASNEIMSSDYEDQGTPNDNITATSQVGEPKFGSLQKQREVFSNLGKSASISSVSCLFGDGKAANKEENFEKAVGHLNAHVICFDDESNDNVDGVQEVSADDVNDHFVEKHLLERNDNGPGPVLVNSHESNIYKTDEGGDECSDGRIGFENVEDSTKLLGNQLIYTCRLNNYCLWDEKSAYVKSFADTPSGRTVSGSVNSCSELSAGKEYECHPYSSCVRNDAEVTEMANEDTGFDHEKMDPLQGDNELGIEKRVEGQNGNKGINDGAYGFAVETIARTSPEAVNEQLEDNGDVLKKTGLPDCSDRLDLNNLFDSINTGSKSKLKVTGEKLDLQDLENMAISSGESKEDSLDFEKNVSIMKCEMNVECSAVSPVTASRLEVGKRDEFEEVNTTLNTTSIIETREVNEVREIDASIAKVVTEDYCDHEHSMVVEEVEKLKHTHLAASDEPSCENEGAGPKEQSGVSVITQELVHCQHNKSESVEFENSIEATEITGSKFAASDKPTAECCAKDSKLLENHVNPAGEAIASESIQTLQTKLETHSHQENSPETKLFRNISYSAMPIRKSNKDCLIPRTPKSLHKIYDMKENFLNAKSEQVKNITATKTSVKRRALEDLQRD